MRRAAAIGYDAVELIIASPKDLEGYWGGDRARSLRRLAGDIGLEIGALALFQHLVGGLADLDTRIRRQAVAYVDAACGVAADLGVRLINFVSPWPAGLRAPHPYPPSYFYPFVPGIDYDGYAFYPKLKLDLPPNFNWDAYWTAHLDAIGEVADTVGRWGFQVAIENHANVMSSTTDSFLRLADHVSAENIGACLDTSWALLQREDVPWAIHKLGRRLFQMHARDGDGLACYVLPIGDGILDWPAIVRAMAAVGFNGTVTLEYSHHHLSIEQAAGQLERVRNIFSW
jgi:sugar phosphate isomerase/epimerase